MEEILEKEKDFKQLIEVTTFLFERSQDLTVKVEDQSSQMQIFMMEQSKLEETDVQNRQLMQSQKERLRHLERINLDLERQLQDSVTELTELRNEQRKRREDEAIQLDAQMESQAKLHDKEQEIALMTDRFEKKLKSMQAELEERHQDLDQSRETITSLNRKLEKLAHDLETMTEKKKKYHH